MFNSRKPIDGDFIDSVPITITPEEENWNPNFNQFERNRDAFTDVCG